MIPSLDELQALLTMEPMPVGGAAPEVALGQSALWYAENGIPVFPLRPGQKTPATINGHKDATTDPTQVREWWQRAPLANIGTPTGVGRFDVLDVDAPDGFVSFAELCAEAAALGVPAPDILAVSQTGSGGRHLFIQSAPGRRNSAGSWPGLDVRASGGYVILPPSVLEGGSRYIWVVAPGEGILEAAA